MKPSPCSLAVALLIVCGGFGRADSPAQAQSISKLNTYAMEIPYYLIQVEYAVPRYSYYPYGYNRYSYVWVTIAESDDLEEAEFIYDLYKLAEQSGVLNEVAPAYGWKSYPVGVRMITEYRPLTVTTYSAAMLSR